MKLTQYTLMKLIDLNEVGTAEDMSKHWCNKNRNWFAWQKHAGNDFSVDAAINCLAYTRQRLAERGDEKGKRELGELEKLLSEYLRQKHKIAAIAA